MADKKIIGFSTSLIVKPSNHSINTLCGRINHFFANLTKDFIPLSQEEVSNYPAGDFDVANDFLVSAGETYKFIRSLNTGKAPEPDGSISKNVCF